MQTTDIKAGPAGAASPLSQSRQTLEKAAKAFEAVFLRQMIGSMRQASLGDGLTDSSASDQFRDMMDSRTADNMAQTGGFGIAELLMRQFGAVDARASQSSGLPSGQAKEDGK